MKKNPLEKAECPGFGLGLNKDQGILSNTKGKHINNKMSTLSMGNFVAQYISQQNLASN